jgi:hypothetical protein
MLHPAAADYERPARSNHMSCVLRIENAFGGVLLTSDIEARDEQALLGRAPALLAQRDTAGAAPWQRHVVDRRLHCRCRRPGGDHSRRLSQPLSSIHGLMSSNAMPAAGCGERIGTVRCASI